MRSFLSEIFFTGFSGFLTAWIGLFIGIVSSAFMKSKERRFKGTVLGLLGGFTLGIVFFDLLPDAFGAGSIYIAIVGIAIGLVLSVFLDGKLAHYEVAASNNRSYSFLKASIFMSIGIGIHNLPSGVALGSLISATPIVGFQLAIALILHGIPEGLTLGIFFRECNASKSKLVLMSVLTSIPMGLGAVLGGALKSPFITSISLSFAGAMILYITLRETLPSANDTWNGRLTTIGNVLGIIGGMLMVSFLHS